jgi:DNA-directed RNA polymerase alpha subunit
MSEDDLLLEDMNLSLQAFSALKTYGYTRLGDLRPLNNIEILCIPNVGGKSYKRILAALGRKIAQPAEHH